MIGRRTMAALAMACLLPPVASSAQRGAIYGTVTVLHAGMAGVVVYLIPSASSGARVVTPLTAEIDQKDLRFVPRVVAVTPGSKVVFSNDDRVMHNVFHPWQRGIGFDLGTFPPGERRSFTFGREGAYLILCHVHPEMIGYVVVVASPYRAVSDDRGQFRLNGVPPGVYLLRTWHSRWRTQQERVTVAVDGAVRIALSLRDGNAGEPTTSP